MMLDADAAFGNDMGKTQLVNLWESTGDFWDDCPGDEMAAEAQDYRMAMPGALLGGARGANAKDADPRE